MNLIFFNDNRSAFLPLTYTRPLPKLRIGILTIEEKWLAYFDKKGVTPSVSYLVEDYLSKKYPAKVDDINLFVNSRFLPGKRLTDFVISNLIADEALFYNGSLVAAKCTWKQFNEQSYYIKDTNESLIGIELKKLTDFFIHNGQAIEDDFDLLTEGRKSEPISSTNTVIGNRIFLEAGARVEAAVLNATTGAIYIGKNAEVMEGSLVRGGLALCEGAALKMGAKLYGPTTIGMHSKIGGEVTNCVVQDFSNKGHDGFIGNSVIGSWCNLGADTNTSNLKNNYGEVKIWDFSKHQLVNSGLQFCGLLMGDHSKCGINTMFNTGTTVGVSANVFDSGFPPKHVPSFSWGGSAGFQDYDLNKMFDVAARVMERRGMHLEDEDRAILTSIYQQTAQFRQ
ncbi:MAG: GlmU family protein [Flavobacteriales bacterium]|nr:GlmU family protein [Flavobacteriales bacterium]